jgi:hypothetical protein
MVVIVASPQAKMLRSNLWQMRKSAETTGFPSVYELCSLDDMIETLMCPGQGSYATNGKQDPSTI